MPTSTLQLTAAELKAKVNPTDDSSLFRYGTAPGLMSESTVLNLLETEEQGILSQMPEHYRQIIDGKSYGEILTDPDLGAREGETAFTVAFSPIVENSLLVYKNFRTEYNLPWESRRREHALTVTTDYTVDLEAGVITLVEALEEEDTLVVDYHHTAGSVFVTARDLVLKAARLELYTMFPNWNDATNVITEAREYIDNKIFAFNAGEDAKGMGEIDRVSYIIETRKSRRETKKLPFMRGAI